MADYLLRAPETDMARWKAEAKIRSMPFSAFIRQALDRATSSRARSAAAKAPVEAASAAERLGPDGAEAASTGEAAVSSPENGAAPAAGSDPPAAGPVDLNMEARRLAERMNR